MIPRATYRLQLHAGFTFADADALVPYLDALGISHVYTSPITVAAPGSTHGYDVVDPTQINPELGGEAAFRALVMTLRERGMGVIIDIVPNHMGVAGGTNVWWNDVLAKGQASEFARFFDIDWRERIVLPVLGAPLKQVIAAGELSVVREEGRLALAYGEQRFPLRDEDQAGIATDVEALANRQHYRLSWSRAADDMLNWRRFFTVTELAGLRIEDAAVFEATHALYFRLYGEGLIDGVRVDHVDGLTDPAGYCRALRARFDGIARPAGTPPGPAYIVVEKILGPGEPLARDWGIDGTTGYDFMDQVSTLLHAPEGAEPFGRLWAEISGRPDDLTHEELVARQEILAWAFEGQLARCVEAFAGLARSAEETRGLTDAMLRRAIERLLWVFPVYRTYGTGQTAPPSDARVREMVRARVAPFVPPGEGDVVDRVLEWLAGDGPGDAALAADAVRRFQQLSAPIAAKAVEDTAFYRYGRLLSRNDVGFDAARLSMPVEDFHAAMRARAADWPRAMLTTATHDHKRGEDTRARLAVVSEVPGLWRERVTHWLALARPLAEDINSADQYMLFQTLVGAWPDRLDVSDPPGLAAFAERIIAWQEKALREAKLRSSWDAPDEGYEAACRSLVLALLDPARGGVFVADMADFVRYISEPARSNSLVQLALRCLVPGVPDLYQGAELADLSLVDPDNRRAVDYDVRRAMLAGSKVREAKLDLLRHLLGLRRDHPDVFAHGDYRPVEVTGVRAGNVLAFTRSHQGVTLSCAVALRCAGALAGRPNITFAPDWWGDTSLALDPPRPAADVLADSSVWVAITR